MTALDEPLDSEKEIARPDTDMTPTGTDVPQFRLVRIDRWNWGVERWVPPGAKSGSKVSEGRWKNDGYFPDLTSAAVAMMDKLLLEGVRVRKLSELVQEIGRARRAVEEAVRGAKSDSTD